MATATPPKPPTKADLAKADFVKLLGFDPLAYLAGAQQAFEPEEMDEIVGSSFEGEDSELLNEAMETLQNDPKGKALDKALADIAKARGVDVEVMEEQYAQFKDLEARQNEMAKQKGIDPPPKVNTFVHPDFAGSKASLRYGAVVGEVFGIDPVFGALLNPTGGMVGPGNMAYHPGDDSATGYHGIVHDAAGYLYNYQDAGPGYDYLDREDRDTGHPLTGQQSGLRYWHEKLNPGVKTKVVAGTGDALIWAGGKVKAGAGAVKGAAVSVKNAVGGAVKFAKESIQKRLDVFGDLFD